MGRALFTWRVAAMPLAAHGNKLRPASTPPKRNDSGNKQTCAQEKQWWAAGADPLGVRIDTGLHATHVP
jgi:hypothetical protein